MDPACARPRGHAVNEFTTTIGTPAAATVTSSDANDANGSRRRATARTLTLRPGIREVRDHARADGTQFKIYRGEIDAGPTTRPPPTTTTRRATSCSSSDCRDDEPHGADQVRADPHRRTLGRPLLDTSWPDGLLARIAQAAAGQLTPLVVDHDESRVVGRVEKLWAMDWTDGPWICARRGGRSACLVAEADTAVSFAYVSVPETEHADGWYRVTSGLVRELSLRTGVKPVEPRPACCRSDDRNHRSRDVSYGDGTIIRRPIGQVLGVRWGSPP